MERKLRRKKIIKNIFLFLGLFLIFFIISASKWAVRYYGEISFEEIIFQLFSPIVTTAGEAVDRFIYQVLIPALSYGVIFFIITKVFFKVIRDRDLIFGFTLRERNIRLRIPYLVINYSMKILIIGVLFFNIYYSVNRFGVFDYIKEQIFVSTFIEENYVDPKSVEITSPSKKRNLIYLYVESLESTYFSKNLGGGFDYNYMSGLTPLTKQNTNFSNTDKFGGAVQIEKLGYTAAGIVAQTSGIPTKISSYAVNSNFFNYFLKGDYALAEILKEDGYNQMFMMGSYKRFANRDQYLEEHGDYDIYDYETAIEKGKIDEDYYVWWGFEDSKLFEYAKEEIKRLSKEDKPFNFSLLTTDTHATDGYLESYCPIKYDDQLSNVISCNVSDVAKFVYWIQKQDFYENTTIVIVGDHLHMNNDYFENIDENYERTVYNLFINSAIPDQNSKNRLFSTMDLFPTTLASLGYTIEGDRLALGTNLYSGKKTLVEKYGKEKVDDEFEKKSEYYNQKIIDGKEFKSK